MGLKKLMQIYQQAKWCSYIVKCSGFFWGDWGSPYLAKFWQILPSDGHPIFDLKLPPPIPIKSLSTIWVVKLQVHRNREITKKSHADASNSVFDINTPLSSHIVAYYNSYSSPPPSHLVLFPYGDFNPSMKCPASKIWRKTVLLLKFDVHKSHNPHM